MDEQSGSHDYDYRPKLVELDNIVFEMYGLTNDEAEEVKNWYRRHYPKLFQSDGAEA